MPLTTHVYEKGAKLVSGAQEQKGKIFLVPGTDNFHTVNVIGTHPPKFMCTCDHGRSMWKEMVDPLDDNDFCSHIMAVLFKAVEDIAHGTS